jgi:hypothetical protein
MDTRIGALASLATGRTEESVSEEVSASRGGPYPKEPPRLALRASGLGRQTVPEFAFVIGDE